MNMQQHPQRTGWLQSKRTTWVLLGFAAVGAFFLITEHTAHLGVLPFLLFLLCPLMMYFMMRGGHGGHGGQSAPDNGSDNQNHDQPPEGGRP